MRKGKEKMFETIKKKLEKVRRITVPWIPFLWRPRFQYKVPTIDFTIERNRTISFFLLLIVASILFGGLVYSVVQLPPSLVTVRQRPGFIYPNSQGQTTTEVFIIGVLFLLGSLGLLLVRRSSMFLTEKQEIDIELYVGYVLILLFIMSILIIYFQKAGSV